ncbi:MAG TPA: hypothetical protein VMZ28_13265, partial [Kofleriaceae bacterium]|nr:hypothetical protein [Kofleriaceae bacterium]
MKTMTPSCLAFVTLSALLTAGCLSPYQPNGMDPIPDPGAGGEGDGGSRAPLPAALSVSVVATPPRASVGQEVLLEVEVRNTGDAPALDVAPTNPLMLGTGHLVMQSAPVPAISDIPPGEARTFAFVFQALEAGGLTFEVGADGTDTTADYALTAAPATTPLIIESAAALAVDVIEAPARVNVGDPLTIRMMVSNGGQSAARAVAPSALALAGSGAAVLVSGPTPPTADIAGGAAMTFSWTYRATAAGDLTFGGGARGADGNSNLPVTAASILSDAGAIDTPAALSAELSTPTALTSGQVFTATLVVRNSGTATAKGVLPVPLMPVATATSGNASATSATTQTAQDIPGGGLATFTWTYTATGTGSMTFTAGARGQDSNNAAVVASAASLSTAAQVLAPAALTVTSFTAPGQVNRAQPFAITMTVKNNGGATANNVQPFPIAPTATVTEGASAVTSTAPAAQNIAAGASATFTWDYVENGTAPGSIRFTGAARGTSAAGGAVVSANSTQTNLMLVVSPPALVVESVNVPAKVSRGQSFPVTVAVRNGGGSPA